MNTRELATLIESPEIAAAVQWWSSQLFKVPCHNSGDPTGDVMANVYSSDLPAVSKKAVIEFERALKVMLIVRCLENWHPDNPIRGGMLRVIATDYGPDYSLHTALAAANIEQGSLRLPIKTVMWVNPGEVKVACGYRAEAKVIYPKPEIQRTDGRSLS